MPATPPQNFVAADDTPDIIVSAIRHWLPELSWSKVRGLLRSRRVAVNGALCMNEGRKLKPSEVVAVFAEPLPPPPDETDVVVHHVDRDIVIVEKPARMVTLRHSAEKSWPQWRKDQQMTLDEAVPHRIYSADRKDRPPLYSVHRIDRDTSGLLVFAREEHIQQKLIEQFAKHDVVRVYRAIIPGAINEQTIATKFVRDRGDGLRGSTTKEEGSEAVTHVRPIRTLQNTTTNSTYTEVECRLETGRTHQIRIHLAERGHPVCGDSVYRAGYPQDAIADDSGAPRLALHAAQLGLAHPSTGEVLHFEIPWPRDMQHFIARLEGKEPNPHADLRTKKTSPKRASGKDMARSRKKRS